MTNKKLHLLFLITSKYQCISKKKIAHSEVCRQH